MRKLSTLVLVKLPTSSSRVAEPDAAKRIAIVMWAVGMGAKMMHKLIKWLVLFGCFAVIGSASVLADRLKDMTSIAGASARIALSATASSWVLREPVTALRGRMAQSLQSMVSQFGLVTDSANLNAKNVARR